MAVVKWIRADAKPGSAFDRAQQRWRRIAGWPDLLGQAGGWSLRRPGTAVVVALWADRAAHDAFLAGGHDDHAERQRPAYTLRTGEMHTGEMHTGAAPTGTGVLRIAACRLRAGRLAHALDVQRDLWLPAMRDAGMRDGLLARGTSDLVVMTWWPSREIHDRYQRERVPPLRRDAGVDADFTSVRGDLVALEPGWAVTTRSRADPSARRPSGA